MKKFKLKNLILKLLIISILTCFIFSEKSFAINDDGVRLLMELREQFKDSDMYVIPIPTSGIIRELSTDSDLNYIGQINMNHMIEERLSDTDIKVVNCCDEIINHIDENIYFKSDSHWQSRGAYYAYKKFLEVKGEECPPLDSYREVVLNENFVGDLYRNTYNAVNDGSSDKLIAYVSTISNIMTIYDNSNRIIKTGVPCINEYQKSYFMAFLDGTGLYTEIEAFNDKTKIALVIKDSFGFPFVPYLVANYDKIYVVDPRFIDYNLKEKMKNVKVDDLIIVNVNYLFRTKIFKECMERMLKEDE